MKPYYDHGGITIYHGDCIEIIKSLGRDAADLVLTDPPYGIAYESNFRQKSFGKIKGDESAQVGEIGITESLKVLRVGRHIYVFGKLDLSKIEGHISESCELIWDKGIIGMGDLEKVWGMQHEYIQFFVRLDHYNRNVKRGGLNARLRRGSILAYKRSSSGTLHPTEKPVSLLREMIESSSRIGETVLDPFLGSGSTALASSIEGRKCIGIEIEERWCELAAKRLEADTPRLFMECEAGMRV